MAELSVEPLPVIVRGGLAKAAKAPLGFIVLLGVLTAFGPISIDMYLPALPSMIRSLHASGSAGQATVAAYIVGLAAGQLFYGPVSDRYGRRRPLLFGVGLYIVGTLGCMLAPSVEIMIACRVIQALGGSAGQVIGRAIVRDRFAHDEVLHILSMLVLVFGLAPVLAPLFGGWILLVANWRWIFAVQLVFALGVGAAAFIMLAESRSPAAAIHARSENPVTSYLALLAHRRLVGYLLTGAFSGAALFTYISSSPDVIIGYYHVSPQQFGLIFGLNAIGFVASNQLNARLARRFSSDTILGWANMTIFGVSLLMVANAITGFGGAFGVLIPMFLIMAGFGFNQSNAMAGALNVDPRRAGTTASLVGASSFAAGAACAALTGLLRDGTPRPMTMVIAASLFAAVISLRTLVLQKA